MTTEAAKAAKAKYDAKTAKYYSMKLNQNTDRDMIEYLDKQESFQTYIKRLIREDMTKQTKPIPSTKQAEANFNATLELMKAITKHD